MYHISHHFIGRLIIPLLLIPTIILMVVYGAQGNPTGQIFTVTNTYDSGSGSLRQAILESNANPGPDIIAFNISSRNKGAYTIQPTSPLPQITDPVIIDGYTQSEASPNTNGPGLGSNAVLKIELDGSMAGMNFVHGLHIIAGDSTVRGMVINRFSGNGVMIFGNAATGNLVQGNFIGTDVSGTVDLGNSTDGVQIRGAANNTIGGTSPETRNIISGNDVRGISIQGGVNTGGSDATGNVVQGNLIGTDVTGAVALGNTHDGVVIRGAANNTIGGTTAGARNVISGNNTGGGRGGISILNHPTLLITGSSDNLVQGNFIGTDVTGTAAIGNCFSGVVIEAASSNTLTGNIIANNGYGIQLYSSIDNQIYNNNFIDNILQVQVTDSDGNIFNLEKPTGGNYWSDWTSPDTDGDGFIDDPYVFTGGVDYLPWAHQKDWLPQHLKASDPSPPDGATDVMQTPILSWTAGEKALMHDVYFGTNEEAVGNANLRSPEYKVTKELGSESYEPGKLEWNTTYYWRVDEYNIDETISKGKVWSFSVVVLSDPLAEALDTNLSFTTGGNANWFSQTNTFQYGGDAAQSGDISRDQESWMQTTVNGTGTVSFFWKVSSEEYFDFLEFYIDGQLQNRISGSVDWHQMTYEVVDSDLHVLEWRYMKDVGTDSGSDCGWVDKMEWMTK